MADRKRSDGAMENEAAEADSAASGTAAADTGAAAAASGTDETAADPVTALMAELAAARTEAAALKDQMLRALAEAENTRRRAQRDREDALKYAVANLARDLLPVSDNLRRALAAIPAEALDGDELLRNLASGVEMTERQLLAAFEKHHLTRIEPLGEKFDSNLHQAMFEVPATGQPAGTIVQVLEPGWLLHDRLLRPAMVAVAKADGIGYGGSSHPSSADNGATGGNPESSLIDRTD